MSTTKVQLAGHRILVAETYYFTAFEFAGALKGRGVDVLGPVPAVKDALALLTTAERIDAAVLAIELRDGLCFPVADELSKRGTPYLFATGYGTDPIPADHARAPCFLKPITPFQLARALVGVLAR